MTSSLHHAPHGIDDPYKPLPTERHPRDPQPGDRVSVGVQTGGDTPVQVELHHAAGVTRHPALALGGGGHTADLGVVDTGDYAYHFVLEDGQRSERHAFTVGRWHAVTAIQDIQATATGLILTCQAEGRDAPAYVTLAVPAPGVCTVVFDADTTVSPQGQPCRTDVQGRTAVLTAGAMTVTLDLDALTVELAGDGSPARASLAFRWLEGGSDLTRIEGRFEMGAGPLYGLGERFDDADKRGRSYDVRVYEEYKEQGRRTYLPVPLVVSPDAWGVWLEADEPSDFDLRGPDAVIRLQKLPDAPTRIVLHLIVADTAYGVTSRFVGMNGGLAVLPKWAFGPWMSSND
ncbi:hypothetical protein, partial [Deinococcus sp.]|uniref:hypothetical protein n=1 Tax=Deinococcus sp. TaxID=47478 RepID=UPI002869DED6